MSYRAGFLGLIGQPNAGKSTLMNFLVNEKVSIVSSKPQTTRRRILGIHSADDGQIVFVDAPGLLKADQGLNGFLVKEANDVIADSDALLAILSVAERSAADAERTLDLVAAAKKPWIGVITKTDLGEKGHRVLILKDMIEKRAGIAIPMAVLRKDKDSQAEKEQLLAACLKMMPEAPAPLYEIDLFTPETQRTLVCEIIREKCFEHLHQELPFSTAVRIILFDENAIPIPKIAAEILVAKDGHKPIVIGKGGSVLKQIGMAARKDIEKLLGEKVFLDLQVSVRENWTENKRIMKELGYVHDSQD